jgi:hypothetical protein
MKEYEVALEALEKATLVKSGDVIIYDEAVKEYIELTKA